MAAASLQTALCDAGLDVVDSYVSLTELSEYSAGMPEEMQSGPPVPAAAARGQDGLLLLPDVEATRERKANWFTLPSTTARS